MTEQTDTILSEIKAQFEEKRAALSKAIDELYELDEKIEDLEENLKRERIKEKEEGVHMHTHGGPKQPKMSTINMDWCDIPGGQVALKDKDEQVQVAPFRMAKFPVTNKQYDVFLEAEDGYRNPEWWVDMPEQANKAPKMSSWHEPSCPRESVSWYEATAFCRWLSSRLGHRVRLPTEAEWQWAAQSCNPDYRYPWGTEMDIEKCNVHESGIGRTTPVDKYPKGQTEQGVYDMIGNTWEWCKNEY